MAGNTEVVNRREGYAQWKSDATSATAKTIGFAEGGVKIAITRSVVPIMNNDGTLSHWKKTKDSSVSITVSKLVQDPATDLLNDPANGFLAPVTGQSTPTGKFAFVATEADGTTKDVITFSKVVYMSSNRSQADNGDTLELTFSAVGEPTYGSTPLT